MINKSTLTDNMLNKTGETAAQPTYSKELCFYVGPTGYLQ